MKAAAQAMASRDLGQVRRSLERAIELDPSYAEAYNLLGFTLGKTGDLTAAVEKLKKAIALDPEFADAHYNLGVALWFQNQREAAAKELDQSLRLNPAAGAVYSFRGMAYRESGDLDGARRALYRAIALSPDAAVPYIDLGVVFLREGQLMRAIGQFEAGLNLPASPIPVADLQSAAEELRRAIPPAEGSGRSLSRARQDVGRRWSRRAANCRGISKRHSAASRLRPGAQ